MIETRGLRKSFTSRQGREKKMVEAVRGVDLDVAEGEIFGFLGPNGAGKTTTLRMLATLIEPDGGSATIAGADLLQRPGRGAPADRVRRAGRQHLGRVDRPGGAGAAGPAVRRRARRTPRPGPSGCSEAFQLSEYADRKCKTYSGGQRRRVDIALGIIHEPKVVFLDEPTSGLDPQSRAHMWDEIRRLRSRRHDGLHHHALPGRGRRALRPALHHGQRRDRRLGHAGRAEAGDLRRRGPGRPAAAAVAAAAEVLGTAEFVNKLETHDDSVRLYVDEGATAIPLILRALDGADVAARHDRAAPAQPRRRLPDQDRPIAAGELSHETAAGHLSHLRAADAAAAAQPGLDLRRRLPAGDVPAAVRARCSSRRCGCSPTPRRTRSSCPVCWCCSPSSAACSRASA